MSDEKINPVTDKAEAERLERCIVASLSGLISQGWGPERAAKEAIAYGQAMYIQLEYKKVNDRQAIEPMYTSYRDSQLLDEITKLRLELDEKQKTILGIMARNKYLDTKKCTNKKCYKRKAYDSEEVYG